MKPFEVNPQNNVSLVDTSKQSTVPDTPKIQVTLVAPAARVPVVATF